MHSNLAEETKRTYDSKARTHDGYMRERWGGIRRFPFAQTRRFLTTVLSSLDAAETCLEIGPGPAIWTQDIISAARPRRMTLVDISEEMLKGAREQMAGRKNIEFINGDFAALDLQQQFDLVVAVRCFEYFSDKPAALREMYRLLRPGGCILIVTKNPGFYAKRCSGLLSRIPAAWLPAHTLKSVQAYGRAIQSDWYSCRAMRAELEETGFAETSIRPVVLGLLQTAWCWKIADRLQVRRSRRPMNAFVSPFAESYAAIARKPDHP